jgi:hypothetical protein
MMRSLKFGPWMALLSLVVIASACSTTRESAWDASAAEAASLDDATQARVADLLNQANVAWDGRADAAQAKAAVDALKAATELDPTNGEALSNLSHAIYFYADCHLRFDESNPDLYKNTHEEGTKAAERALGALSPEFAQQMAAGSLIEDALGTLDANAVPALYWRSSNLGRWATLDSFATLLSYKDEIRAIMEFCLANDPTYWYQAPDRYFGVFYAKSPGFAGGDMNKSAEHFNISMEAHPDYWGTRTLMAEEWAIKEDNKELYLELIDYVLQGDPNVVPYIKPENMCEQRKAQILKDDIDEYF